MYTVKQVADLAGVTPRTLHHYDAIGLLAPTQVAANGYRLYGEDALLRLQQILLYRELGLDLDAIARLMHRPQAVVESLEHHREALQRRLGRLRRLIQTVDKTIAAQKGETTMNDAELVAGLTAQQKEYAEEALERWDPQVVRESHRRYGQLTAAQKQAMKDAGEALNRDWAALIGSSPTSAAVQAVVARWVKGIEFFYTPTPATLVGLARMYRDDARFGSNFDKVDVRLVDFVCQCVEAAYPDAAL